MTTARIGWPRRLSGLWEACENPVMTREMRSRMRGGRSYVVTGAYTLLVSTVVLAAYATFHADQPGVALNQHAASVGRAIWTWGCCVQAWLLPLMVPAFTCGAITLERERDLLEMLLLTRQSPLQICLGKLGSGVGLGILLVLSSVPALSLAAVLGGLSPFEMLASLCVLASSVLVTGALGLAISTLASRTSNATFLAYLVVGAAIIGVPIFGDLLDRARSLSESGSEWGIALMLLALTAAAAPPALALAAAAGSLRARGKKPPPSRSWWLGTFGLCWAGLLLLIYLPGVDRLLLNGKSVLLLHPVFAIFALMNPAAISATIAASLWWLCTLLYIALALWCLLIATLQVRRLRSN